jgi:hypothetical protein
MYLPLGWKSIKVACANPDQLKILPRVRDWQLTSSAHSAEVPVTVKVGTSDDTLELDLSHTKLPVGQYRLAARWDWDPLKVQGAINLRPFADFSRATLTPDSEDCLVEGAGMVKIQKKGESIDASMKVSGLHSALKSSDVLRVAGPRPKITSVSESAAPTTDVALRVEETGASDQYTLGRVIRLPHLERFLLTDKKDASPKRGTSPTSSRNRVNAA